MIGFPKHLNSKFDYEYVKDNFPRQEWEHLYKGMLDEEKAWFCVKKLDPNESGYNDTDRKVIEFLNNEGEIERYQYEFLNDPNSTMALIGYNKEEIINILETF